MSIYRNLRPRISTHRVTAGWSQRSYFVVATDVSPTSPRLFPVPPPVIFERGTTPETRIGTLYGLLAASWCLVDWQTEAAVLKQLALDPLVDSYEATADASVRAGAVDKRPELRELLMEVYGQEQRVELPITELPEAPAQAVHSLDFPILRA